MQPIEPKKSLVEQTYDVLVEAICSREMAPGDRLNQDEIAARLMVSRQPVNSAIAILKAEGLVEEAGGRGVIVAGLDETYFQSVYEYRLCVEPLAVKLAVDRKPGDAGKEAAEVLKRGKKAVTSGQVRDLQFADRNFHEMIYRWSGNQVIQNSMRTNWRHIQRAMAEVLGDPARPAAVWAEHEAILSAILSGDGDKAADHMRDHIHSAYDREFRQADRGS